MILKKIESIDESINVLNKEIEELTVNQIESEYFDQSIVFCYSFFIAFVYWIVSFYIGTQFSLWVYVLFFISPLFILLFAFLFLFAPYHDPNQFFTNKSFKNKKYMSFIFLVSITPFVNVFYICNEFDLKYFKIKENFKTFKKSINYSDKIKNKSQLKEKMLEERKKLIDNNIKNVSFLKDLKHNKKIKKEVLNLININFKEQYILDEHIKRQSAHKILNE